MSARGPIGSSKVGIVKVIVLALYYYTLYDCLFHYDDNDYIEIEFDFECYLSVYENKQIFSIGRDVILLLIFIVLRITFEEDCPL